ncbi:UDP-glycosyltransferase superfamily protein, putative [Medicago truncatula]|uniref:UDP-glycosyltransferase superfamily protein, putative n=1 Tax=Medicago truncatula TaxID=3880 RepID=A0A072U922_MEDTR|nr:UDP-glycosyltransferase superfamily protein, putative [Medicago truncatula]
MAASTVALFLYTPTIHHNTTNNDVLRNIPGLPSILPDDMPEPLVDRGSQSYNFFVNMSIQMRKIDDLIGNSFENLEPKAFLALKNGAYVMEEPKPHVFCVGPLVQMIKENNDVVVDDDSGCLSWLNLQPSQSVVFLSFGSYGRFLKRQIKEIALGLKKSDKREELSFEELFPLGFLERTKEKGKVVKDWAPQVKQRLNRVVVVEEMKVALALKENEDGFVHASEFVERVGENMDKERGRGKEVRERVMGARNEVIATLSDGRAGHRSISVGNRSENLNPHKPTVGNYRAISAQIHSRFTRFRLSQIKRLIGWVHSVNSKKG